MTDDTANRLVTWALVLTSALSLAVFLGVVAKSLISWKAVVLLLVILAPALFLSYRLNKAQRAYDRGRYGIGRRVVTERTTLPADGCSVCGYDTPKNQPGIRRRFVKELVVDGVPVALIDSGQNDYCPKCAETALEPSETNGEIQPRTGSEERESIE
ncbi:hypothetical protein [Haladaptatus caseinilyticus]|uniref:hypothetical protein n=1 Tax=Haladaptatus caseinilyticus TaxID=2993314 RepID=UPI00224AF4B2|nr:hypothetical protein [Haladaptatus caseinilyticus]